MSDNSENQYLTVDEAAQELRVHPETVRRFISAGDLPVTRLGHRTLRIKREDWDAFLAARTERKDESDAAD